MNEIERIEEERFVESLISLWIQPDAPEWIIDYARTELRKQRGLEEKDLKAMENLLKDPETIKPTINEYGKAYCVCGENVGIFPNNKNLPSVLLKYCPECGKRMKWE